MRARDPSTGEAALSQIFGLSKHGLFKEARHGLSTITDPSNLNWCPTLKCCAAMAKSHITPWPAYDVAKSNHTEAEPFLWNAAWLPIPGCTVDIFVCLRSVEP